MADVHVRSPPVQVDQHPRPQPGPLAPYAPLSPETFRPPKLPARIRVVVAVVVGLAVSIAGVTAATLVSRVAQGNPYPAAWDLRVAELADFVEEERGLEFEHPVHVDFLTPAQYREQTMTEESALSSDEKKELASWSAQTRALGLVSGDIDLNEAFNSLSSDGTLAFYDPVTERVTVRGTDATVGLRVTLVHELTHVLQDQHFDIDRQFDTDGAALAFRALVEGDAVRVENGYIDGLSAADAEAYWDEFDTEGADATNDLEAVPAAFQVLFGAPYPLGEAFVDVVMSSGSQQDLDALFRDPPHSELALLDPASWLDGEELQQVPRPKLGKGEKEVESGDLGALTLHTMLASRIDPRQATAAVDGWDGDAYVAFEKAGRTCVRFAVAGDDGDATQRLHDALGLWAATLEPATPKVTLDGSIIRVLTCDPGTGVDRGPDADKVTMSLALPVTRSQVMAGFLDYGVDAGEARCIGDGVITTFTIGDLADPDEAFADDDSFDRTMERIVGNCVDLPADDPSAV